MTNSDRFEDDRRENVEDRRSFIKQWAEYIRTHDDEEWARQQHELVESQLESARELSRDERVASATFHRFRT